MTIEDDDWRLQAEETYRAIQRGEIDGLMVTVGGEPRVFTLDGADAFYRALVEQMPEGAAAVNDQGQVIYANTCLADLIGRALEVVVGSDVEDLVPSDQGASLRQLLDAAEVGVAKDFALISAFGDTVPVSMSVSAVDGHAAGTRCLVVVDLSHQQRVRADLHAAETRFHGAFDNAPIGMALLDAKGCLEQANAALCALLESAPSELVGRRLEWLGDDDLLELVASGESSRPAVSVRLRSGREVWLTHHLQLLRDADGSSVQIILQVSDESERYEHEQLLTHVAEHDTLTGLLNRRGFDQVLERHLAMFTRRREQGALMLLDVDHFKNINDTRGHQVGDQVLVELARTLKGRLRDSDLLARLGGDEFAILLPIGDTAAATSLGHDLLAAVQSIDVPMLEGDRRVSISLGIAPLTADLAGSGEAMARADLAMYDAKESGRNRLVVADGVSPSANATRITWLDRIEVALSSGTLELDAQPLIDLRDHSVSQYELLVRLTHDGVRVSAGEWFPVAERYGLAPAVDLWVLDQAVRLLNDNPGVRLAVNISATSVGRTEWRDEVRDRLERSAVDASRLTFEITETAAIGNLPAAVAFTEDLRSLGCKLALDDFGAGFASFYYLKHLPFDDVKIDGEFVRESIGNTRDQAIIRAMVDVARSGGQRTVAEAIEDAETLDLVAELGVDLAQGYHIGRPQPVELVLPSTRLRA